MCMGIIKDCKNLEESYGQICVLCNKCGRFDKKILTKDQRIAELEKENEEKEDKILDLKSYNSELKETISKLSFSAVRCQAINDEVCQYILDNELLKKENAELKAKLENDLENLTAYDLKKSHEYSIKGLIQANEILSKQCKNIRISYKEFLSLQKENEQLKQQLVEKDKLLEM